MPFKPGIDDPPIQPLNHAGAFWLAAVAMNTIAKLAPDSAALVLLDAAQAFEQASLRSIGLASREASPSDLPTELQVG